MTFSQVSGTVADRIAQVRQQLPPSVRLIAVTKQVTIATMREAYQAGIRDFGESKVQEAEAKQAALQDLPDVTWHLIGHLQSNKVQKALELFDWIHSIDSLKLAQRVNQLSASLPRKPQVCLQVKLLNDPDKYGWTVSDLLTDLVQLDTYEHLRIQGLMTIPPLGLTTAEIGQMFQNAQVLAASIQAQHLTRIQMQELSMGMSGDYLLAVPAGATMVRLGRILFGDRQA